MAKGPVIGADAAEDCILRPGARFPPRGGTSWSACEAERPDYTSPGGGGGENRHKQGKGGAGGEGRSERALQPGATKGS